MNLVSTCFIVASFPDTVLKFNRKDITICTVEVTFKIDLICDIQAKKFIKRLTPSILFKIIFLVGVTWLESELLKFWICVLISRMIYKSSKSADLVLIRHLIICELIENSYCYLEFKIWCIAVLRS